MYKIGFDLGGTKLEGIILDENNKEIERRRVAVSRDGYDQVLNGITDFYHELRDAIGNENHTVGLGTPGIISKKTGLLKNCPNIPGMNGQPFQKDLKARIRRDIKVENDANCFAYAEALIGAGKGKEMVFGVIMGTGCGGGIIFKGDALIGLQENASEWGHSTINFNGPPDNAGVKGAVESYISGTGLQARYKDKFGESLKGEEIVENYKNGNKKAVEVMDEFFDHFGIALANIITILDPDIIVLGGGLSNIDELYTTGIERVKKFSYIEDLQTPIVKNEYGDSAGVYGAALVGV